MACLVRTGSTRLDAVSNPPNPQYAACYFGLSLTVAIAETVLRDQLPIDGEFRIAPATLDELYVLRFGGAELVLTNLTGVHLKRLSGNADLAGHSNYQITQQWGMAVHANPGSFDGFVYMSRHINSERAVVLFDRAADKVRMCPRPRKLVNTRGFRQAAEKFHLIPV